MGGNFYPSKKPGYYSYTQHFVDEFGGKTGYLAKQNTVYPGLDGGTNQIVIDKALSNLKILIDGARAAEIAFITDTGININDLNNSKDIFKTINLIFNSKQTFERGLRYMKSLSNSKRSDKDKMYRDVSRYFMFYLNKAIKEEMQGPNFRKNELILKTKPEIEQLINNIITTALIKSYEKVKDFINEDENTIRGKIGSYHRSRKNEEEVQAITDMIDIIQKLGSMGTFGQFGALFGLHIDELMKDNNAGLVELKKKTYKGARVDANFGGNALEMIIATIGAEFGNINIKNPDMIIQGKHTGNDNKMKADALLFVGTGEIDTGDFLKFVDYSEESVRLQNVNAMEEYLKSLQQNIKHVVAVSSKNYSIKSDFGGINAQEEMDLKSASKLLTRFGVHQVTELVNYLANCGPEMIRTEVADAVRTELQTYIGYFLFDNLEIDMGDTKIGPNVVNLINVSGLYMPLSVYLEGLYRSIEDVKQNPSRFVKLSISLGGPTERSEWTEDTWKQFREDHETESFISFRILSNLADFITSLA